MPLIVVCYDVASDRRRYRIERCLEAHGVRVQKSVFECHLDEKEFMALRRMLNDHIDEEEDSLLFYPLCSKDRAGVRLSGLGELSEDWGYRIYRQPRPPKRQSVDVARTEAEKWWRMRPFPESLS